ncbi:hypothetical protein [Antrihabitans sp. YC2-6]|uniref:hypothetical protein n=1 Tax=Antrihabitans sp. YC2-6 TaxID=2799498 RepID=UPI0018F4A918|nr:hypothetical protein [Antrihabitans sp. YC2-6]MBJ8347091.1 hypothetical protein [Antrihabitans sp. YC2-6]
MAGGRVAKIFVAETHGVVLTELTPEAMRDQLAGIEDQRDYLQPASLDAETTLIAAALAP